MPRRRRSWVPGEGAHIISRFVDRRFFLADEADRQAMLESITKARRRWDWRWLSFALMSSHLHYGMLAGERNPDPFFRSTHTRFALRFHRRTDGETLGPVFADRPSIDPVRKKRLLRMVAYHHRNPTEAGVALRPADSRWTSHRLYLRLDPEPLWFDVEWALDTLGFKDTAAGRREFDEFVTECDLDDFVSEQEPDPRPAQVIRTEPSEPNWNVLVHEARRLTGLPKSARLDSRSERALLTRWLIASVACHDLDQTYAATGRLFGMSRGSVCNLLRRRVVTPEMARQESELRRRLGLG